MAPRYKELMDRGAAAVDGIHGERVRIEPKSLVSQYKGVIANPERVPFELTAVLRISTGQVSDLGFGRQRDHVEVGVGGSVLYVSRVALLAEQHLEKDDVVVAIERPGEPRYKITRPDMRGLSRIVVTLSAIGGSDAE